MIRNDLEYPTIHLKKLTPHPENPKDHTPEQVTEIADSIENLDWGRPIVISNDYYILAGEGAYLAAIELGERNPLGKNNVPYKMMKWRHTDPEALAYMLADNKLGEKSDWNYGKLEIVHNELKIQGFRLELTGFSEEEMGIPEENYIIPDEEPEFDENIADDVELCKCPECGYEFPK